jgi:glycosyltransferase involved in cell wall biosynthesis
MDATGEGHGVRHTYVSFDGWKPRENTGNAVLDEVTDDGVRLSAPSQLEAAKRWAQKSSPDVIHIHDPLVFEFGESLAKNQQIPILYTVHIGQAEANRVRNIEGKTRSSTEEERALECADHIHVASAFLQRVIQEQCGRAPTDISLVRWPVPVVTNAEGRSDLAPLIVSRFGYLKGTDRAFELLSQWFHEDRSVTVEWHGGLPDSAKSERRWIRKWRQTANDNAQARLKLRGWSPRREILKTYKKGRIFLSMSRHESFGLSVAEAMARGCAVAAVPAGALGELIDDGTTGVSLSCEDNSRRAIDQLRELRASPAYRETLGLGAKNRIRELCDPIAQGDAFAELYRSLL